MLTFSISYLDLIKFHYFADTIERGDSGVKGGPKTGWRFGYFLDNSITSRNYLHQLWQTWISKHKRCDVDVYINVAKIELYLMNIINKGDFKSRDKDQRQMEHSYCCDCLGLHNIRSILDKAFQTTSRMPSLRLSF